MSIQINNSLSALQGLTGLQGSPAAVSTPQSGAPNFADVFAAAAAKQPSAPDAAQQSFEASALKFSAHAQSRLKSRNIEITPQIMNSLNSAVQGAAKKGSNNSLILLSDLAFIVNVPNRTVVTALDGDSIRDNVFTNIDSTVLAR